MLASGFHFISLPLCPTRNEFSPKAMFRRSPVSTLIAYPGNQPSPFVPLPSGFPSLSTEGAPRRFILGTPPSATLTSSLISSTAQRVHFDLSGVITTSTPATLLSVARVW